MPVKSSPADVEYRKRVFVQGGRIDWRKYTANGVTLGGGPPTSSNTVSDLQDAHDGNQYTVQEIANNPGQHLMVDFASVTAFNWVQILGIYAGGSNHALTVALEVAPFDGSVWHTYMMIEDQVANEDFNNYSFFVPDDTPYINGGVVDVKIGHEMNGTASQFWTFGVIALYQ